jgi:hypothetical protein
MNILDLQLSYYLLWISGEKILFRFASLNNHQETWRTSIYHITARKASHYVYLLILHKQKTVYSETSLGTSGF